MIQYKKPQNRFIDIFASFANVRTEDIIESEDKTIFILDYSENYNTPTVIIKVFNKVKQCIESIYSTVELVIDEDRVPDNMDWYELKK